MPTLIDVNVSLCSLFVGQYNVAKEKGKTFIPNGLVAKEIMLSMYKKFCDDETIQPIENLLLEEKKSLVNECREMENNKFTNETLSETSKILSVIRIINLNT